MRQTTGLPFLKWPGGKRRLVKHLLPHLNGRWTRLVEPFCGSAALSLAAAAGADRIWLNDINSDLINVFRHLLDQPDELISSASLLFTGENNSRPVYYALRKRFNEMAPPGDLPERAALFLYLNRHGYNGLCRYNASGHYNVPFGRYRKPRFPEPELRAAAAILKNARLSSLDFEEVMSACGAGDVVYCDPPYVPLSSTASFTTYAGRGFSSHDQARLAAVARAAAGRGALVIVSNHDTPETRSWYHGADHHSLDVRRLISCRGGSRTLVRELIAVYRPVTP